MKTALYDRHHALGAKCVPFAGWEMPLQYQGILAEHQAVRQAVGLFDVSHMGRILVRGKDAEPFLDFISTNRVAGKEAGSAIYTVLCHEQGGSVDDVIIYKISDDHFFVVANASNRMKDLEHFKTQAQKQGFDIDLQEEFSEGGTIALQGPLAQPLMVSLVPEVYDLRTMHVMAIDEGKSFISRTGYTGAGGYELHGSINRIVEWWDLLLDKGKPYGIVPAGLGARDTLRLEMGFALYGHELSDQIAPNESVSAWTIKWDKSNFLGKRALEEIELSSKKRWAYGIRMGDKGIPRQGCRVFKQGNDIGEVTSGSFSPTLGEGIGLLLVNGPLNKDEQIEIQIRQNFCRAHVAELPFVRKSA